MHTRFDNATVWVTADHRHLNIKDMETSHLMNTYRMFIRKPYTVLSMLIKDFEDAPTNYSSGAWSPDTDQNDDIVKVSIFTATSMTLEQLTEYATNSPLGRAIFMELANRGVNISAMVEMWKQEESSNEKE